MGFRMSANTTYEKKKQECKVLGPNKFLLKFANAECLLSLTPLTFHNSRIFHKKLL